MSGKSKIDILLVQLKDTSRRQHFYNSNEVQQLSRTFASLDILNNPLISGDINIFSQCGCPLEVSCLSVLDFSSL